jgi:broad specificity phosphatase PhoE
MEPPALTRHRKPFLAPIWLPALAAAAVLLLAIFIFRDLHTTTIVIVRHAEKALSTIDDPPLSAEGEERAERLALMFSDAPSAGRLEAIFVTNTRRSQQTASALAARLHLVPTVTPLSDVGALASRVLRDHRGGAVLIVAHSNTIPELIRELSGKTIEPIADNDYGNIYVLSVPHFGTASLVHLKF